MTKVAFSIPFWLMGCLDFYVVFVKVHRLVFEIVGFEILVKLDFEIRLVVNAKRT